MKALVVGGSSGLGLELAYLLAKNHRSVTITGRENPKVFQFRFLDLTWRDILLDREWRQHFQGELDVITDGQKFDTVVYNPGFYQEGRISELTDDAIFTMINVGLMGAALLMQRILNNQKKLSTFVAVTSTSQWTPRKLEPVYTAAKAGLGMLANSLSLDSRIKKTLVVGPSGMKTKFWKGTTKDTKQMLDPQWVAEQIVKLMDGKFQYKFARIMRQPARVEVVETR